VEMWSGGGASGTWLTSSDHYALRKLAYLRALRKYERVCYICDTCTMHPWHTTLGYDEMAL